MTTPETKASDTVRLEPCEVTQEDRQEAAKAIWIERKAGSDWSGLADQMRRGLQDDHPLIQAFARHRLNTRPLSLPKGEEVERICIQIEDILGNGPAKEPRADPSTYDPQDAFNEGHTRGWWEACQMLEPVLTALSTKAPAQGDIDACRSEVFAILREAKVSDDVFAAVAAATYRLKSAPAQGDVERELCEALEGLLRMTDFEQSEPWVEKATAALRKAKPALASMSPTLSPKDAREAWQSIETAPMWQVAIVTDGENVAKAQKAEADNGGFYWAIDPEDALDWEPTHWLPFPCTLSAPQSDKTA